MDKLDWSGMLADPVVQVVQSPLRVNQIFIWGEEIDSKLIVRGIDYFLSA